MSSLVRRPCQHYSAATARECGKTGARHYIGGWRCPGHSPAALAGKPEARPDPDGTLDAIRARTAAPTAPPPRPAPAAGKTTRCDTCQRPLDPHLAAHGITVHPAC